MEGYRGCKATNCLYVFQSSHTLLRYALSVSFPWSTTGEFAWSSKLWDLGKKQTFPCSVYQQATCPPSLLPYWLPSFIYKERSTWEGRQMAKSLPWPLPSSWCSRKQEPTEHEFGSVPSTPANEKQLQWTCTVTEEGKANLHAMSHPCWCSLLHKHLMYLYFLFTIS